MHGAGRVFAVSPIHAVSWIDHTNDLDGHPRSCEVLVASVARAVCVARVGRVGRAMVAVTGVPGELEERLVAAVVKAASGVGRHVAAAVAATETATAPAAVSATAQGRQRRCLSVSRCWH